VTAAAPSRLRRRPAEAEREILAAAEALLREGTPVSRLVPARVMARTGLGRSSFYVYFRDAPDLLRRLLERIEGELFAAAQTWLRGGGDVLADARRAVADVVEVYVRHGPVLRAVHDATRVDPRIAELGRVMVEHFTEAVCAGAVGDRRRPAGPAGDLGDLPRADPAQRRLPRRDARRAAAGRPGGGGGDAGDDLEPGALPRLRFRGVTAG
jgi:AcrR family transcriptional regulator